MRASVGMEARGGKREERRKGGGGRPDVRHERRDEMRRVERVAVDDEHDG